MKIEKLQKNKTFLFVGLFLFIILECIFLNNVNSFGNYNPQNIIHVPISWCVVKGSPASENPDIPNPLGGTDNTTDKVLESRIERVTNNIYLNQTGVAFKSAINHEIHPSLNFPSISDPNLTVGNPGNMTFGDLGMEYNTLYHECTAAWNNLTINNPDVVTGIIALNIGKIVDSNGKIDIQNYTGIGKCSADRSSGLCKFPYDGRLAVIDNFFLIPGVFTSRFNHDPLDEALGHELGHTLSLQHRGDSNALMNTNQQLNGPNNTVGNIYLNNSEITKLRNAALQVPGVEIDQMNKTIKGNISQFVAVDNINENSNIKAFDDLSSIKVNLDRKQNTSAFSNELMGTLPEKINGNVRYWMLLDTDDNKTIGANNITLEKIGVPKVKFLGTDLVVLFEINSNNAVGKVWTIKENMITQLQNNTVKHDIQNMTIHLDKSGLEKDKFKTYDVPLYSNLNVILNNTNNLISLNKPIQIQGIVESNGTIVDTLDNQTLNKPNTY